jgi:hypothetical protein
MKSERKEKSFEEEYKTNPVRPEPVEGQTPSVHGSTSSPRTDGEGSL